MAACDFVLGADVIALAVYMRKLYITIYTIYKLGFIYRRYRRIYVNISIYKYNIYICINVAINVAKCRRLCK